MADCKVDELKACAETALEKLRSGPNDADLEGAKKLVESLRNVREYDMMGRLAEAVSRVDPQDPKNRRLYAQCLIETGKATAAADVLRAVAQRLPKDDKEYLEACGLLGRAHKQIYFDAGDKTTAGARNALEQAIAAYRGPFEANNANTWHGVNLVALLTRARWLGLPFAPDLDAKTVAGAVVKALEATPLDEQDEWFLPTLAEAKLGLGDYDEVERTIHQYAAADDAKPFLIASTLRQFTDVWNLEDKGERGKGIVAALRARLTSWEMSPDEIRDLRKRPEPDAGQLQAILGKHGVKTYRWWKAGLDRAVSIAAVRQRLGPRIGSGFLVRAADIGLEPADELFVITNFHVVNKHGALNGITPEQAEIVFEVADQRASYAVAEKIVWSSTPDRHDVAVLRLETPVPPSIAPLPIAKELPKLEKTPTVYIVGHPGGNDLAYSCQDNELLDHEGPPGIMQIPGVCRVH
jgi:tetratricopeptide (TPR) repeat protein